MKITSWSSPKIYQHYAVLHRCSRKLWCHTLVIFYDWHEWVLRLHQSYNHNFNLESLYLKRYSISRRIRIFHRWTSGLPSHVLKVAATNENLLLCFFDCYYIHVEINVILTESSNQNYHFRVDNNIAISTYSLNLVKIM
jgi:hypothetical protein